MVGIEKAWFLKGHVEMKESWKKEDVTALVLLSLQPTCVVPKIAFATKGSVHCHISLSPSAFLLGLSALRPGTSNA